MKTFEHPNLSSGWKCPICKTDRDKPVVLIAIYGTEEGNNCRAQQYHLDCIELTEYQQDDNTKALAMFFHSPIEEESEDG